MLGMSVESFKNLFFDSKTITGQLSKESRKAQGKMGAYLRQVAKNSLKYTDGPGAPGQPPHVHRKLTRVKVNRKTGAQKAQTVSPLKELIFFGFDPSTESTVVGPILFASSRRTQPVGATVPGVMERGGTVSFVRTESVKKGGRRATERQKQAFLRKLKDGTLKRPVKEIEKTTTKQYKPHPFMAPALAATAGRFPMFFK